MSERGTQRICYYIGTMDVKGKTGHGGPTHVLEVFRQLSKRGYEVTIVSIAREERKYEVGEGVNSINLVFPHFLKGPLTVCRNFYIAARLVHMGRKRYDAVYARASATDFVATFMALLLGLPFVLEVNDPLWSRVSLKWADRIISTSSAILRVNARGEKAGEKAWTNKFQIVTWAGNVELFRPDLHGSDIRRKYRLPEDCPIVIYVGAFYPWHGLSTLVEASTKILEIHPETRFLCVGSGALLREVVMLAREKGVIDKFVFTGNVPYEEVPFFLAAADVAVAPYDPSKHPVTKRFGFFYTPIKLFEYMAAGKPIVATETGNIGKVLRDGWDGLLAKPGDPKALAEAIIQLIDNKDLAHRLGVNARVSAVTKYSWDKHGEVLERIIADLLRHPPKKNRILGVIEGLTYFIEEYLRRLMIKIFGIVP